VIGAGRWTGCAAAAALVATVVLAGPLPARADTDLVSLEETYQPFADHFNETAGQVRFVAILSPTCGHCLYGARTVASELIDHYKGVDFAVSIVWAPMLEGDDEASAREAAQMFDDPRVVQYWDPERFVGYLYRFDVFAEGAAQMAASLWPSHPFYESMQKRADTDHDRPEWDLYMWFEPGLEWEKDAVAPSRFIRQFAHWQEGGATLSLMWIDSMESAPATSNLADMMGSIMHELIPHE